MLSLGDTICVHRPVSLAKAAAQAAAAPVVSIFLALLGLLALAGPARAAEQGGEANLHLPDLGSASFLGGSINGHNLLLAGMAISALGLLFGLIIFVRLRNMPVHSSMREVSELIYETCKTYLGDPG